MKIITFFITLALSSLGYASDWSMYGANAQHTGKLDKELGDISPVQKWSFQRGETASMDYLMCVGDGKIFTVEEKVLTARSLNTGAIVWRKYFPDGAFQPNGTYSTPSFSEGRIFLQHSNHQHDSQLYCIDANSGKIIWDVEYDVQWARNLPPTLHNGKVYIVEGMYGGMAAYRQSDGEKLFFKVMPQKDDWVPSCYGDHLYAYVKGVVYKIDANTAETIGSLTLTTSYSDNTSVISISDGVGYLVTQNTLYAIDLANMGILWSSTGFANCSPSVNESHVFAYASDKLSIRRLTCDDGSEAGAFNCSGVAALHSKIIICDDKLIRSSEEIIEVFDIQSTTLVNTITPDDADIPGRSDSSVVVVDNTLLLNLNTRDSDFSGKIIGYRLRQEATDENYAPFAPDAYFEVLEGESLSLPALPGVGLIEGAYDVDGAVDLSYSLHTGAAYGTVQLNSDGSFTYTPNQDFHGYDSFSYVVSDGSKISTPAIVSIDVKSTEETDIKIEIFSNGQPVFPGQQVSGIVTGKVTFRNAMMNHTQFYKNFRILKTNEHGHMLSSMNVVRTFELDTSEFYDGENLISVHAHPHNHQGMPYKTEFYFETFKLVTVNDNPSPSGDWKLPEARVKPGSIDVTTFEGVAILNRTKTVQPKGNQFLIFDDSGSLDFEQNNIHRGNAQAISHLGASVLGRFRWMNRQTQHAEFELLRNINLINYQRVEDHEADIVFFISDPDGRANYAKQKFTIPAASAEVREQYPLPALDAKFVNISQGDSLILEEGSVKMIQVEVSGARHPLAREKYYRFLNLWLGNSQLTSIELTSQLWNVPEGEDSFIVEIPLEASLVKQVLEDRGGVGAGSTAFAMWMDIAIDNEDNLPTSEHVHLTSIRTLDMEWPHGKPQLYVINPPSGYVTREPVLRAKIFGKEVEGMRAAAMLPSGIMVTDEDEDGLLNLPITTVGQHQVSLFLVDGTGQRVQDSDRDQVFIYDVQNALPSAKDDRYYTRVNGVLTIDPANGVLKNDFDIDGGDLSAEIIEFPNHGTLGLDSNGGFVYSPNLSFTGVDRFTYRSFDGEGGSVASVDIVVNNASLKSGRCNSWVSIDGDAQNSNAYSHYIGLGDPVKLWELSVLGGTGVNYILDNTIYYQTVSNDVSVSYANAVDLRSGAIRWQVNIPVSYSDYISPTIDSNNFYVQHQKSLYALDLHSGLENWLNTSSSRLESEHFRPIMANGHRYYASQGYGLLHGESDEDGSIKFASEFESNNRVGRQDSQLAYTDGVIYLPSKSFIHAFDANNGNLLQSGELTKHRSQLNSVRRLSVEGDYLIGIENYDFSKERLVCLNRHTLKPLWYSKENGSLGGFAVSKGKVYSVASSQIKIYDVKSGLEERQIEAPRRCNKVVACDNLLIASSITYGETYIFDKLSGQLLHTLDTTGSISLYDEKLVIFGGGKITCYLLDTIFEPKALTGSLANGSISFDKEEVAYGESVTATIQANEGYYISRFWVNGEEVPLEGMMSTGVYTHTATTADLEMDAEFVRLGHQLYTGMIEEVGTEWKTVQLPESYLSPVITTTLVTTAGRTPVVTRLRNVTKNSFEIKVQRASNVVADPGTFSVTYMVANEGQYTAAEHGVEMDVFQFESDRVSYRSNWQGQQQVLSAGINNPVVFGQVQSSNDSRWSETFSHGSSRTSVPTAAQCFVGLHVAEDGDRDRLPESIGCIILQAGTWTLGDFKIQAGLSADNVSGYGNGIYSVSSTQRGFAQVAQAGVDGNDGGWAVLLNSPRVSSGALSVAIDEDTFSDSERSHTSEQVAFLTSTYQGDAKLHTQLLPAVSHEWQTVTLPQSYRSMVVAATPVYASDQDPRVIRVRNARGNSFEIRAQAATGSDIALEAIPVSFVAAEEGKYTEQQHGIQMEAGKVRSTRTDTSSSWVGEAQPVGDFYSNPVVLGQVMSFNDSRWSTFWSAGTSATNIASPLSLRVGKHVGQDSSKLRSAETLGYLMIESGDYLTSNGLEVTVGMGSDTITGMGNDATSYSLDAEYAIVTQAAMDGGDGSWAVLRGNAGSVSGELLISADEDTIYDSERYHIDEQVGYLIVKP